MTKLADRVRETTTTTGTGTVDLDGAVTGFQTLVAGVGTTNQCFYCINHTTLAEWEIGLGTVTDATPDTLSRTTILSSSNSGSAVTFSGGTKDVFVTPPAQLLSREVVTITSTDSPFTPTTEKTILCDATSGVITVNLPASATTKSMEVIVKKIDSSANAITVDGNSSETIDGATTKSLASQYDYIVVTSDGSNMHVIG